MAPAGVATVDHLNELLRTNVRSPKRLGEIIAKAREANLAHNERTYAAVHRRSCARTK